MSKVLLVGIACWDVVNVCDRFPNEDEDIRALSQRWDKGGNAANSVTVLGQLGVDCELFSTLAPGPETDFVLSELRSYGVRVDKCVYHVGKRLPNSLILINRANGSRTIVHHRDLPELTFDDFTREIDLKDYKWIHFEGRNASHVSKMIHAIRQYNSQESSKITISVEIEKTKPEIECLLPEGDVGGDLQVFISKDFSRHHGCQTAREALRHFASKTRPQAKLICAWGEEGAYATEKDAQTGKISEIYESPAFPPPVVIDTLGAGDTFNATVIDCLNKGQHLQEAIVKGCKIAGKKCGQEGHKGLILHY